ncbi:hypothetical protein [Mariprofundus ferrooxydans]|uniref:hypothetical protein n=1 Tax=Mariprofundus ferrooxydans TaxID=314344 RepID=UPI000372697A|nr:hypothetical protein [Mariprofundus ferrooxydans]
MVANPTQPIWQWNIKGDQFKAIPMALLPFQLFQTSYRAMGAPSLCSYRAALKPYHGFGLYDMRPIAQFKAIPMALMRLANA